MSGTGNKRKRRAERHKGQEIFAMKNAATTKRRKVAGEKSRTETTTSELECLIFQDVLGNFLREQDPSNDDEGVSLAFFELANSTSVGFRVEPVSGGSEATTPSKCIVLKQDMDACGRHTGGIVWETAYLLLQYILSTKQKLGKTLEVGSGCGLVGQVLAAQKVVDTVVMTEHADVIPNLKLNVERNRAILKSGAPLHVCNLDWERCHRDAEKSHHLTPHSFDTILGTDVVFAPKLVEPLWKTLKYMSHPETNIYLCLQERCAASHKLLLEKAIDHNFKLEDITRHIDSIPSCRWGNALDCRLFHISLLVHGGRTLV